MEVVGKGEVTTDPHTNLEPKVPGMEVGKADDGLVGVVTAGETDAESS